MSLASDYITLSHDGTFYCNYRGLGRITKSVFVAYAWVNNHLRQAGLPELDIWEAQEIHWQLIGRTT